VLTRLGVAKLWGEDPERAWRFARFSCRLVLRASAPSFAYGGQRVARTGGAVVAANHFATVDPALIGIHSPRTIYFMTKVELVETPLIGEILRWTGAFAVRRGEGDRDALRVARWLAREGHVVGMFMEGTRQKSGHPGPVHPGAVMIAVQEAVPIIPCGIDTFGWSIQNRRPCCVVWGEPITLNHLPRTGRGYKEGSAVVEAELVRLWRQATDAVAAGFPARLADGALRTPPLALERTLPASGIRPWPHDAWAAGPLGPVHPRRPLV
jgi:1-acyl-sn-glycerol-3-phosphate acyltransferase